MPAPAADANALFQEAIDFSMWFPLGQPKPGAPTVYMIADPQCPHCANAISEVQPLITAGDIDLRIILVPVTSQDAFHVAMSILQSPNPPELFLQHETELLSSTGSPLKRIEPASYEASTVRGLARNLLWIRNNGIRSVPFWLYDTAQGAQYAPGGWDAQILQQATAHSRPPLEATVTEARP